MMPFETHGPPGVAVSDTQARGVFNCNGFPNPARYLLNKLPGPVCLTTKGTKRAGTRRTGKASSSNVLLSLPGIANAELSGDVGSGETMNGSNENPRPWAIVLAGGEGKRLASYTRSITGETTPKQFCPLVGNQSLLEQTWARVSMVVRQDRILTALTRTQERFYEPLVGEIPSRNLVIQPQNRGTAPAILYALLKVAERDPSARVGLFPCDHFVDDDREFMRHVELAWDVTEHRPELTVLLGIAADRPETGYGWIEPGEVVGSGPVFSVRQFWEKPNGELAIELLHRRCFWNSFVIVGRASTLLGLFIIALPDLYFSFKKVQATFGTALEEETIRRLYDDLSTTSFSDDVLVRHRINLGVLPIAGVRWNDLGEPHRVIATLQVLGIRPHSSTPKRTRLVTVAKNLSISEALKPYPLK